MGSGQRGKLTCLVWALANHPDAVEYDLHGIGVDLRDFWRGELSTRRLWMFLRGCIFGDVIGEDFTLVPGTATAIAVHGEAGRWTHTDHILASISDAKIKGGYPRPKDKAVVDRMAAQARRWKAKYRPEG